MDGPKLLGQAPQAQRTPWHALEAARKAFGLKLPCKLCQLKTPECPRGGVGFGMAGPGGKLLDGGDNPRFVLGPAVLAVPVGVSAQ